MLCFAYSQLSASFCPTLRMNRLNLLEPSHKAVCLFLVRWHKQKEKRRIFQAPGKHASTLKLKWISLDSTMSHLQPKPKYNSSSDYNVLSSSGNITLWLYLSTLTVDHCMTVEAIHTFWFSWLCVRWFFCNRENILWSHYSNLGQLQIKYSKIWVTKHFARQIVFTHRFF